MLQGERDIKVVDLQFVWLESVGRTNFSPQGIGLPVFGLIYDDLFQL